MKVNDDNPKSLVKEHIFHPQEGNSCSAHGLLGGHLPNTHMAWCNTMQIMEKLRMYTKAILRPLWSCVALPILAQWRWLSFEATSFSCTLFAGLSLMFLFLLFPLQKRKGGRTTKTCLFLGLPFHWRRPGRLVRGYEESVHTRRASSTRCPATKFPRLSSRTSRCASAKGYSDVIVSNPIDDIPISFYRLDCSTVTGAGKAKKCCVPFLRWIRRLLDCARHVPSQTSSCSGLDFPEAPNPPGFGLILHSLAPPSQPPADNFPAAAHLPRSKPASKPWNFSRNPLPRLGGGRDLEL